MIKLHQKTNIIAHRGASAYAPENTMTAFRKAYEMGADGIELDVLFSKDDHIMVHHDFDLGRCEAGTGAIKEKTYFELRKLDLGSWFSPEFKGEKMPSIEEVLEFIKDNGMLLNIEIKTGSPYDVGIENKLVKLVEKYGVADQIIYSSFNHCSVAYVKKINENAKIAALTSSFMINPWEYLKLHDFDGYHPHRMAISDKTIQKLVKKHIFVNPYGVNSEKNMHRFIADGVSGIITDYPDVGVKVRKSFKIKK